MSLNVTDMPRDALPIQNISNDAHCVILPVQVSGPLQLLFSWCLLSTFTPYFCALSGDNSQWGKGIGKGRRQRKD